MFCILMTLATSAPIAALQDKEKELPAEAKKELKTLEGRWQLVKSVDSKKEYEAKEGEMFIEFKNKRMSLGFGDEVKESFEITAIDTKADPRCIDILEKRKGKEDRAIEGVYKLDGDTLQIALHVPQEGKQRPADLGKPTDPRTVVLTLKRVKK